MICRIDVDSTSTCRWMIDVKFLVDIFVIFKFINCFYVNCCNCKYVYKISIVFQLILHCIHSIYVCNALSNFYEKNINQYWIDGDSINHFSLGRGKPWVADLKICGYTLGLKHVLYSPYLSQTSRWNYKSDLCTCCYVIFFDKISPTSTRQQFECVKTPSHDKKFRNVKFEYCGVFKFLRIQYYSLNTPIKFMTNEI